MKSENKLSLAIRENPVLVLFLGACPMIAQSTDVRGALGMGLAILAVLLLSGLVIFALRKLIPENAKLPVYVLVTAFFVSCAQQLMAAFFPVSYGFIGMYLAVAAVDLALFNGLERSGSSNKLGAVLLDSLTTGLAFTLALLCLALIREVFGSGSFAGIAIPFLKDYTVPVLAQAPGGLVVFGMELAVISKLSGNKKPEGAEKVTALATGLAGHHTEVE